MEEVCGLIAPLLRDPEGVMSPLNMLELVLGGLGCSEPGYTAHWDDSDITPGRENEVTEGRK